MTTCAMPLGNFSVSLAVRATRSPEFTDVRELQRRLKGAGITPLVAADESTKGPAHLVVVDPDGNPVLIDPRV